MTFLLPEIFGGILLGMFIGFEAPILRNKVEKGLIKLRDYLEKYK